MHYHYRGVNEAFDTITTKINDRTLPTISSESRNGPVLVVPEPVVLTFAKPKERVLFNTVRDCNPFFHVYEALWMLAGRNDLARLQYYVSTFGDFSDDGATLNGAYGYRWRRANPKFSEVDMGIGDMMEFGTTDQLTVLAGHLMAKPDTRRAVLQMWNVEDDLLKIDTSKDVCCNLSVVFQRTGPENNRLDMSVFNRSNDIIWGMLGANFVHFTFLQEYMAARIGCEVGSFNQMTTNAHVYQELFVEKGGYIEKVVTMHSPSYQMWRANQLVPLVQDPEVFEKEVVEFVKNTEAAVTEPFLVGVAAPMALSYRHHKEKDYEKALEAVDSIQSADWKYVAEKWMKRRQNNYRVKKRGVNV